MVTKAIVCTVTEPDTSFEYWVKYHLSMFDIIYLFADKPEDLAQLSQYASNRVILRLGCQEQRFDGGSAVMHRQETNVNFTIQLAFTQGIEWLAHLDADELFCGNVNFDYPKRIGSLILTNHELLHYNRQIINPFTDCKYFKLNGNNRGWDYSRYSLRFLAYANGKGAVRVSRKVQAYGVHGFVGYSGVLHFPVDSCILHYYCPTFDDWYRRFSRLGNFSDYWWNDRRQPIGLRFQLESRNIIQRSQQKGQLNLAEAQKFYDSLFVDERELSRLVSIGNVRYFDAITSLSRA